MKLTKLFTSLLVVGVLFSCSKEELTIEETGAVDSLDLVADLSTYEDTSLGMYKGVFTTADSEERGTVEIKVINDETAKATITYLSGEVEFFDGAVRQQNALTDNVGMDIMFNSNNSSFVFNVDADGTNPVIENANSNSRASLITVVKENTRGAVVPLTGSFASDAMSATVASGTWSIIFNTGNGEGDDTDITTQTIFNTLDFGSATGNAQSGCVTMGDETTCTIGGMYTSQGIDITWTGTHLYTTAVDCSSSSGTWSTANGLSGSFITDTQCVAPENDLCAGALPIACDDSFAVSTDLATNTDADANCGANANAGIWYIYTDSGAGDNITVSLAGSTFDTTLNVYTGACGALVCLAGDDDGGPGLTSELTFQEAGDGTTEYYIYASAFGATATGTMFVSVTCAVPPPAAPGDTFDDPLSLTPSAAGTGCAADAFTADLADTTNGVFSDSTTNSSCGGGVDIFYEVVTTTDGLLATSGNGNPTVTAYAQDGTELSCIGAFGAATLSGWTIGDTIIIQVADAANAVGFCLENFTIPSATPVACGTDSFVDPGGNPGPYDDVQVGFDITYIVDAGVGNAATVDFSVFALENTWDYMRFYDGDSTSATEITTSVGGATTSSANGNNGFTGGTLAGDQIVSSGQFLTIVFQSDTFDGGDEGWVASVNCDPATSVSRGQQQTTPNGQGLVNVPATEEAVNAKRRALGLYVAPTKEK